MLLVTKQIFLSNKEVRLYRNPFCKVVRHLEQQVQSVIGKKTTTSIQSDLPLRITLQPLTGVSQLQAEAICWTDSKIDSTDSFFFGCFGWNERFTYQIM